MLYIDSLEVQHAETQRIISELSEENDYTGVIITIDDEENERFLSILRNRIVSLDFLLDYMRHVSSLLSNRTEYYFTFIDGSLLYVKYDEQANEKISHMFQRP